ncbi:hypothetical protein ACLMJK_004607 [Lecanora helva]
MRSSNSKRKSQHGTNKRASRSQRQAARSAFSTKREKALRGEDQSKKSDSDSMLGLENDNPFAVLSPTEPLSGIRTPKIPKSDITFRSQKRLKGLSSSPNGAISTTQPDRRVQRQQSPATLRPEAAISQQSAGDPLAKTIIKALPSKYASTNKKTTSSLTEPTPLTLEETFNGSREYNPTASASPRSPSTRDYEHIQQPALEKDHPALPSPATMTVGTTFRRRRKPVAKVHIPSPQTSQTTGHEYARQRGDSIQEPLAPMVRRPKRKVILILIERAAPAVEVPAIDQATQVRASAEDDRDGEGQLIDEGENEKARVEEGVDEGYATLEENEIGGASGDEDGDGDGEEWEWVG